MVAPPLRLCFNGGMEESQQDKPEDPKSAKPETNSKKSDVPVPDTESAAIDDQETLPEKDKTEVKEHHRSAKPVHQSFIRTFIVFIFSAAALALLSISVLAYWAEHTLTDTNAYVKTVGPLAKDASIKSYIATKLSDAINKNASYDDLAQQLQPLNYNKVPADTLKPIIKNQIDQGVKQAVNSPQFEQFWQNANQDLHSQIITALNGKNVSATIDATATFNQFTKLFQNSPLAFITPDQLNKDNKKRTFEVTQLDKIRSANNALKKAMIITPLLGLLLAGLAVWISRRHWHTFSRISFQLALITGLYAIGLYLLGHAPLKSFLQSHLKDIDASAISAMQTSSNILLGQLRNLYIGVAVAAIIIGAIGALMNHRTTTDKRIEKAA
jgi:hypothetical protein